MAEGQEEFGLQKKAEELQAAIVTVLFWHSSPEQLRAANGWITAFLSSSLAWTVSLYVAFPPAESNLGLQQEVRFFSLNLLLSKIRTDWQQIEREDAREIYEVLARQLPASQHDKIVGPRLCVVTGAAAALVGADACCELVEESIGSEELQLASKVDLLTVIAEETLHRGRDVSWMVRSCMQECCPQVLEFLKMVVMSCRESEIIGHAFTCFERWIPAGVVLSDLFTEHTPLFTALLDAVSSSLEIVFQPAVWALSELVSQVDVLPGREGAISLLIKALLAHKWEYCAAANPQGLEQNSGLAARSRGLCLLVSQIGTIEGAFICRAGLDGAGILEWLIDASAGGGGLGLEGALMAVEAWPRLVFIPYYRRGEVLQASVFAAAAKAILQAAKYPQAFETWDGFSFEEEQHTRFRVHISEGVLNAVFKELGGVFLSVVSEILNGTASWQDAEVCLFAITAIHKDMINAIKQQSHAESLEMSFLKGLLTWLLTLSSGRGSSYLQNETFLETSVILIESYAEWMASQGSMVQQSIQFVMTALSVDKVRLKGACALKGLCHSAASSLVGSWPVELLIGSCEAALSWPTELPQEEENEVQIAVVRGLASVVAVMPSNDAELAFTRLTCGAVSIIKCMADGEGGRDESFEALNLSLRVVAAAVEYAFQDAGVGNPAWRLLQDIWPVLEKLSVKWAGNAMIAAALCDLWGIVAEKVGVSFMEVLPGIIVAASAMFKLHKVPSPILCLINVVTLVALRPTPDLEKSLVIMLAEVTSMLSGLDKFLDKMEEQARDGANINGNLQKNGHAIDYGSSLSAVYELGRSFLHYLPAVLLPTGAFLQMFSSASGSLNRKDPDVALSAALFLVDSILGPSGSAPRQEQRMWNLPLEIVSRVDHVAGYYGAIIVQALLRRLASSGVVDPLKEALADVLFGLSMCYPALTESAIISTLDAHNFPGKHWFSIAVMKKQFLAAVFHRPPHPRLRFQDLMRVFCGVCQWVTPSEALDQFCR